MSQVDAKPRVTLRRIPLKGQTLSEGNVAKGTDPRSTTSRRVALGATPTSGLARERFARTFADVMSGRFGGRWTVEWEGGASSLTLDRDGRSLTGKVLGTSPR